MTENGSDPGATAQAESLSRMRRLFDIRLVVGGLMAVYGVMLTVVGVTDGSAAIARAGGVRINLWTGLGMLVVGVAFLAWARLRPLAMPSEAELADELSAGQAPDA